MSLEGKAAVVPCGGRGIWRAVCERLAAGGVIHVDGGRTRSGA